MTATELLHDAWIGVALLVTLGVVSVILRTLRNGVPPMPSSQRVRSRLTVLLRWAKLPPAPSIVELGSGWGGLVACLGRSRPTASVTGYENSAVPYLFSFVVSRLLRFTNVRFVRADFRMVSLRDADLVVCYLSPDAMTQLQPKLAGELKSSAFVASLTFALPEWRATRVVTADDLYRTRIYLYQVGDCRSPELGRRVDIREGTTDDGRAGTPGG